MTTNKFETVVRLEDSSPLPWYKDWWWSIQRGFRDVWNWFRYRFIPRHRYHTLKLHEPGYRDPRSQLIYAVAGVVDRYVHELRVNWHSEDLSELSDEEVVQKYIDWMNEEMESPDIFPLGYRLWRDHYADVKKFITWWNQVKDSWDLDGWTAQEIEEGYGEGLFQDPHLREVTHTDKINEMLHLAIDLRERMWT